MRLYNKPENKSRTLDRQPRVDCQKSLVGNGLKSVDVLQRKGGNILQVKDMLDKASKDLFGHGIYEDIIEAVSTYHDDSLIPANDYGRQFMQLVEIRKIIRSWEQKNGAVTQEIQSGFWGVSKQEKRREVLRELNNSLPQESMVVLQQGFDSANQQHAQDRAALLRCIDSGFSNSDQRLKNSCEWVRSGKTKLYAVTPTGDSYARLIYAHKNPVVDEAFFPEGVKGAPGDVYGPAVTYKKDNLNDNTNVSLTHIKRTGGWNDPGSPGIIAVVNADKKPQNVIWETLRHEVQHDADKHKGRDSLSGYRSAAEVNDDLNTDPDYLTLANAGKSESEREEAFRKLSGKYGSDKDVLAKIRGLNIATKASAAEVDLITYKTEFRAYSYQEGDVGGSYSQLDNSVQDQSCDGYMFSKRQLAIFLHIYHGYANIKKAWDNNPLLYNNIIRFRQAVQAYWSPDTEGFNKYNSVRIDDFYLALDVLGDKEQSTFLETKGGIDAAPVRTKVTDPGDPLVKKLFIAIRDLDESDRDYILKESPAMLAKIRRHLDGAALQAVEVKFDLMKRLDNIRNSPLHGFSEASIKMEKQLLEKLYRD